MDMMSKNPTTFGQSGHTPIGVSYVQVQGFDLMTFKEKLATIHSIDELYGFANRRRVLGVDLPKWTDEEVALIVERKFELQKLAAKGGRK